MTDDFTRKAYHPRETRTNQILNLREHRKVKMGNKNNFASLNDE